MILKLTLNCNKKLALFFVQKKNGHTMKKMRLRFFISMFFLCSSLLQAENRIVSLNGSVTEIIFALGAGSELVGVDTSSLYPAKAHSIPKIGYQRTLTPEGILSLNPDLILGTDEAGPATTLESIQKLGKKILIHKGERNLEGVISRIEFIGDAIGKKKEASALTAKMRLEFNKFQKEVKWKKPPKILFIHARGAGVNVAGKDTAAHDMIQFIGGKNIADSLTGYKPISAEFAISAKPDIIIIPTHSLKSMGGMSTLQATPGIKELSEQYKTPIVDMDDLLLLGFSSRFTEGLFQFHKLIKDNYKD